MHLRGLAIFFFILLLPCVVLAEDGRLRVVEMAVTTKVAKGKPVDSVHRISARAVKALFCFTRLTAPPGSDTVITHHWHRNGTRVASYELPVKGERWRTFSKRPVTGDDAGEWKVDVVDSEGRLLKSVTFRMN